MEASLHRESVKTSANQTKSITSQAPCSIRRLTDRLNDLWIPWRELWKKLGLHLLKKLFNNSFRYIGLLRIKNCQLHNRQPKWYLHVEYGMCTTNYKFNKRSQEEQISYQQNAIIPEKKYFSKFLKTINLSGRQVRSREEQGNWCTLYRVHNSRIKYIWTNLKNAYRMRQIAVLQKKQWWVSSTTLLIFQPF